MAKTPKPKLPVGYWRETVTKSSRKNGLTIKITLTCSCSASSFRDE